MQFLAQIPTAILNNIGFMALLYLIYTTYKFFKNNNANHLFNLAAISQLLGLLHFAVTFFLISNKANSSINQLAPLHFQIVEINSLLPYMGLIYFLLLLFFLFKTILQFNALRKFKDTANYAASDNWNTQLNATYSLNNKVKIGFSSIVESPITFGWLDPVIILPVAICNQMSVMEIKLILLHEIAHIMRNDYFIHLIIETSHKILYFNPFSYFFVKEISMQREMSCDAWVLTQTNSPIQYSKTLYTLAANTNTSSNTNLYLGVLSTNHELLYRIKQINRITTKSKKEFGKGLIISAVISLLFFTPVFLRTSIVTSKQSVNKEAMVTLIKPAFNLVRSGPTSIDGRSLIVNKKSKTNQDNSNPALVNNDQHANVALADSSIEYTSYIKLVDQTVDWIKARESITQFSSFDETKNEVEYSIAEKLLMRAIIKNYQLKKALLQDRLTQLQNEKEAIDLLNNSIEWKQMLQYEKWTKEFLKLHPLNLEATDSLSNF